jgi:hypothetical protein
MDRRPSSYLDRILTEGKPRANAMDGWLLVLVVFCLFTARVLYCAGATGPFQACMQSGMPLEDLRKAEAEWARLATILDSKSPDLTP